MISIANHKRQVPYPLYLANKNKEPDYLLNVINKIQKQKQNLALEISVDHKVKSSIRKHLIQKRVNNILNISPKNNQKKVSPPVPFVQKTWIPPLIQQTQSKQFSPEQLIKTKQQTKKENKDRVVNVMNILNINTKLKYFGQFLSTQFDGKLTKIHNLPKSKQNKLEYLSKKFSQLQKRIKPKLCILPQNHKLKKFFNPLQEDILFKNIMRKNDPQLAQILIKTLEVGKHFSLTSFTLFYDIFVWQNAEKEDLLKFVTKILMEDSQQLPIYTISSKIDLICKKINLEDMRNLQNFGQIMKKLLFGQEYVFSGKDQYYLTRKAMRDSLQMNEQCISIFINIFYA